TLDAFKAAARDYNRAKLDQKAEAVENDRKRFVLDWPLDVFQPGTIWKGTTEWALVGTNQRGAIPATLTVLDREDATFKARFEDGTAIREVSGTIKGNQIGWLAKNVKDLRGGQGSDHNGKFDSTNLVLDTNSIRPEDKGL